MHCLEFIKYRNEAKQKEWEKQQGKETTTERKTGINGRILHETMHPGKN
jgi:hypothetical protein